MAKPPGRWSGTRRLEVSDKSRDSRGGFLLAIAEEALRALVPRNNRSAAINCNNGVVGRLGDGTKPFLAVLELMKRLFKFDILGADLLCAGFHFLFQCSAVVLQVCVDPGKIPRQVHRHGYEQTRNSIDKDDLKRAA